MLTSISNLFKVFKNSSLLTLILKMTRLLKKSTSKKLKFGDNKIIRFDVNNNSNAKLINKLEKLKKLFKSQKLAKLKKKLLKNWKLYKIVTKKVGSSFFIPNAKAILNYLPLIFIKTLIFNILIKTNTLSYAINNILN